MSTAKDDRMTYFIYLMFKMLQFVVLNCRICSNGETWAELEKYWFKGQAVLPGFEGLLDFILCLLGVEQPRPLASKVIVLEKYQNDQPAKQKSRKVALSYVNRAVVYSQM